LNGICSFQAISGGIRLDADPNGGPRLFLYRQTANADFTKWTYLGPVVSFPAGISFPWSGNSGINFETAGMTRLNENGHATDAGTDPNALDMLVVFANTPAYFAVVSGGHNTDALTFFTSL
jgi:beta-fructofuranosidase